MVPAHCSLPFSTLYIRNHGLEEAVAAAVFANDDALIAIALTAVAASRCAGQRSLYANVVCIRMRTLRAPMRMPAKFESGQAYASLLAKIVL